MDKQILNKDFKGQGSYAPESPCAQRPLFKDSGDRGFIIITEGEITEERDEQTQKAFAGHFS
jgi:hypothetical protein